MGDGSVPGTRSRRFPQGPRSAGEARRFVRAVLCDAAPDLAPDLLDTAQLLVSELVTNAVLHARTDVEVSVRAGAGALRVEVSDRRPRRPPVPHDHPAYTGTGQGLVLLGRLASRHGVDTGGRRKTVWFELLAGRPPGPSGGWEAGVPPAGAPGTVTLLDVPTALYTTSQQHRHALLREVVLARAAGHDLGVPSRDLATAQDISDVITACVSAALRRQPARAESRALPLAVPPDAGPSVRVLDAVLDLAEEAAQGEHLLTLPALPRGRVFHRWLLDEITGQLAGAQPTAWTVVPREQSAAPSELVPWDAGQVRADRVPTIAVDEDNRIIAANGPAAGMLGWHPDELVGQPLNTIIPHHLRARHAAAHTSLLLSGQPRILGRSVPLPALHRDGGLVPIRLFIRTQETADGRTVFVAQLTPRVAARVPAPSAFGPVRPAPYEPGGGRPSRSARADDRPPVGGRVELSPLERLSLLADTGTALSDAVDLADGLQRVGRALTERLADWCAVDLLSEESRAERVCIVRRAAPWPEEYEGLLPPVTGAARGPLARALRGAGPLLLAAPPPPGRTASPLDAHYLDLLRGLGARSAVVAPLRARREIVGALTVARAGPGRPFVEADLPLVDDVARTLALGVDNARLYHETRNIAERLQRSLLPVLPRVGRLRLAARYAASSTTAQVGGDWYDSFVLPDGDTALVIGDVTGHNLDAAIAMSQLRSMLRGIAMDRQEPPQTVLRCLDLANHSLYREATATCVYAVLKDGGAGPWELLHSCAGHLPPLLVGADGTTRYLEDSAGLMLGVDPGTTRRGVRDAVPAHSTVLLYTDGLIERRYESLSDAMERLRRHAAAVARAPLDVFCDELLIRLGAGSGDDDIAVLAARPTPSA